MMGVKELARQALYVVVFVDREDGRRIINLHKTDSREVPAPCRNSNREP